VRSQEVSLKIGLFGKSCSTYPFLLFIKWLWNWNVPENIILDPAHWVAMTTQVAYKGETLRQEESKIIVTLLINISPLLSVETFSCLSGVVLTRVNPYSRQSVLEKKEGQEDGSET